MHTFFNAIIASIFGVLAYHYIYAHRYMFWGVAIFTFICGLPFSFLFDLKHGSDKYKADRLRDDLAEIEMQKEERRAILQEERRLELKKKRRSRRPINIDARQIHLHVGEDVKKQ